MFYSSYIEISESALRDNIRFLRRHIGPDASFASVIKANAYGHGISPFVTLSERCGVRCFAVFSASEAFETLRTRVHAGDIIIMGSIENDALEWAVENDISFYIFEMDRLEHAAKTARKLGRPARIHLELETGLNRTGIEESQLPAVVAFIKDNERWLQIDGVCSHFAGAESVSNYFRIQKQIDRFKRRCTWLRGEGLQFNFRHTACSAAAFNYPETIMDMVRFGIAQYGFWPSQETQMQYHIQKNASLEDIPATKLLRRVLKWKSHIMSVKQVRPGEFVSYGTTYLTTRRQTIASVPVGYFHGFPRSLSNRGQVLIRGRRAQVVGMVNMNMMMVDVTDFPGIAKGEEVVIIGKQKKAQITVGSFSDLTRDLSYEILVRLPSEIPRKIVR